MTIEPFTYTSITRTNSAGAVAARAIHISVLRVTVPPGLLGALLWLARF